MPVTFFAHQAPVLPVARRWPNAFDGVALVIGSMAPDFAYVLNGSRVHLWAHGFPGVVTFCVPVTLIVAWIVVRVLAPVVPDHLPGTAPWFLRDYRGLATHRFGWIASPTSALLGALSHVGLDHFTHDWGWFARHVSWYHTVLVDHAFGRTWTVYRVVQYVGHIGGTAVCLWMLAKYGRRRWMLLRAREVSPPTVTRTTTTILAAGTLGGFAGGVVWARVDGFGWATDVLRVAATTFAGLTVAALVVAVVSTPERALAREPSLADAMNDREGSGR